MRTFLAKLSTFTFTTALLISFAPAAFAEDCMHDPIYEQDWNAEVTTGARVRDIPCMETSVVITTLPVGEVVKVIAETDGYYKIRRADSTEGWVGQWLIAATTKAYNPSPSPSPSPSAPANEPLYDVTGHKYEAAIRFLAMNSIINGYPDGSFKPDGTLNRAEMVKIMSLTYQLANPSFDFNSQKSQYDTACFKDIAAGQWYTSYVCYAKEVGILQGYPDGTFKPDKQISRVEALKIVLNSLDISVETMGDETPVNYFDDTDTSAWYWPYINTAYYNDLIEEKSGNYYPDKSVLRGEVSNLVYLTYLLNQGS